MQTKPLGHQLSLQSQHLPEQLSKIPTGKLPWLLSSRLFNAIGLGVLLIVPPGANVVTGKWVFRHNLKPDGSLERYKAEWVIRGFTQHAGIDFGETVSG